MVKLRESETIRARGHFTKIKIFEKGIFFFIFKEKLDIKHYTSQRSKHIKHKIDKEKEMK